MSDNDIVPGIGKRIGEFLILALYLAVDIEEIWPKSHFWALAALVVGIFALLLLDGASSIKRIAIITTALCVACALVYVAIPNETVVPPIQPAGPPSPPTAPSIAQPPPEPMVGWLQPANEPTPINGCSNHGGEYPVVIMGDNGASLGTVTRATLFKLGSCPLISLQKGDNGARIDATIYDAAGRIIATIEDNRFSIPPADGLVIEKAET